MDELLAFSLPFLRTGQSEVGTVELSWEKFRSLLSDKNRNDRFMQAKRGGFTCRDSG